MNPQPPKIVAVETAGKNQHAGRKGERARAALMDAALELLSEMSPRELTAGTICIAAQMKRPSFYTYFDSVDDLLDAMIRREIERLESLYEAQGATDKSALHRLVGIPLNLVEINRRDANLVKSVVTLMGADPGFTHLRMENLRRDVRAAIAEGSLTLDAKHVDLFSHIFIASILSLMARDAEAALTRAEIEDGLVILLRGAGAEPALLQDIFKG